MTRAPKTWEESLKLLAEKPEEALRALGEACEVVACLSAQERLDAGFRGMGHNIVQEKAAQLRMSIRDLRRALERLGLIEAEGGR
jgi:hypothetical protein